MLDDTDELNDLTSWLLILEKIVARSANMVVITDAERRIRWVNRTYTQVTGWALEEAQGKRAGELVKGPQTDQQLSHVVGHRLRQGLSVSGVEMVNYRKDQSPYTVLLSIEPIRDRQGQPVAYFSIQSDISEKRALEQANARLQHHLQVAQRLARLGRVEFDADTGEMHWSSEVFSILEHPPDDDSPKSLQVMLAYVDASAQQEVRSRLRHVMAAGDEFDHEIPITTRHGHRRWVRCRGVPALEVDTVRPPSTWTIQDVTVYRELIEQKRLTNERLQAMVEERTLHLEEANRSLEAFSHALSHDLKKPIRHMVSFAEIVRDTLAEGDLRSAQVYCDKIVGAGKRMQSMIEGMLAFSRMGRRAVSPGWIGMDAMTRECLVEVTASFPERQLQTTGLNELPPVWADPVLMREVWINLIDNAIKYSRPGPPIRLNFACDTSDKGWTLSLQDNGCGFNAALETKVFEMFSRASPDASIPGDGIGLALCQRIVSAHGGRIWATSRLGEGSVFFVFLPSTTPHQNARNA